MTSLVRCASFPVSLALAFVAFSSSAPTSAIVVCVGDCDEDGKVGINEIVVGVDIALGRFPLTRCQSIDADGDGGVTIGDLVRAVHVSIEGPCPISTVTEAPTAAPSPTPTLTPPPSPTPTRTRGPVTASIEVVPLGNDFSVGGGFPASHPEVCAGEEGAFTVTWYVENGTFRGINAKSFDATGAPRERLGLSSPSTFGVDSFPRVACGPAGDALAIWGETPTGVSRQAIFAARISTNGELLGNTFQVNVHTGGSSNPTAAMAPSGQFVVVWSRFEGDGNGTGVLGRRFSSDGAPVGEEFQVNHHTAGDQASQAVVFRASGDFLVVWAGANGQGPDAFIGRRLSSDGLPEGGDFQVATLPAGGSVGAIEPSPRGDFVVVWNDRARDGNGYGVFGRRFDSGGGSIGGEFQINSWTSGNQYGPDASANARGEGVIVWSSDAQDGADRGIYAQRFDEGGQRLGSEFLVNSFTINDQTDPSVAMASEGFVVVWQGFTGVYGRRFGTFPAFVDRVDPCFGAADLWSFEVRKGQTLTLRADTVDAETAADLCFKGNCGSLSFEGDDESGCRFTPTSFACPQITLPVPEDARCELQVGVCSRVCGDEQRANYSLLAHADGRRVVMTPGTNDAAFTPAGTPKRTPTPTATASHTPTPTRPPSVVREVVPLVYRSLNGRVYVVVPGIQGARSQITSLSIATAPVTAYAEQFDPNRSPADFVLTAFAGASASAAVTLSRIRRTEIVAGLDANLTVLGPNFDPCAISGDGLLTFPTGEQVTAAGNGPHAPEALPLTAIVEVGDSVPAAIERRVSRRVDRGVVARRAIVFPNPGPPVCVGSSNSGAECFVDETCDSSCAQAPQGCCARASRPPTCSTQDQVVCDPTEVNSCFTSGVCDDQGGEVPGQNVTLDDALDSRVGNPDSQSDGADGIVLEGNCSDPATCEAIVFEIDAGPTASSIVVGVAGFLLDGEDRVIGTVAGLGKDGAIIHPDTVTPCGTAREFAITLKGEPAFAPDVCKALNGDFVVVWHGASAESVQNGYDIFGRRYRSDGSLVGSEFLVNTSDYEESKPRVACDDQGGFVVAWSSTFGVRAQRFSSTGVRAGSEAHVSTQFAQNGAVDVAAESDGSFLVAWGEDCAVLARLYAGDATALGDMFHVNTYTDACHEYPSVTALESGDFVVAWSGYLAREAHRGVLVRRFTSAGEPLQRESGADTADRFTLTHAAVDPLADGGFVVAWSVADLRLGSGLRARLYDSSGNPVSGEIPVDTAEGTISGYPAIAQDASGGFVVVWQSDENRRKVLARRYRSNGSPAGPSFQVDTGALVDVSDRFPAIASDPDRNFIVVWQAMGFENSPHVSIFGQRIRFE